MKHAEPASVLRTVLRQHFAAALTILALALPAGACSKQAQHTSMNAPAAPGDLLPCDVVSILQQHCLQCHGTVRTHGAPLTLVRPADFQADLAGMNVGALVITRIQDPARPMPPPPDARLTPDEIATISAFIQNGAAGVSDGCSVQESPPPVQQPTGSGGSQAVTDVPRSDSSGAASGEDAGADHGGSGGSGSGNPVGGGEDTGTSEPEWSMFGHDLSNSRSNPDEHTLSVDNVAGLQRRWQWSGAATTSTPAVADGTAYLPAWDGKVYALHVADGSPVWTASLPNLIDSSPTVTSTQVFVSDNMGFVHALERASGNVQWSKQVDTHAQAHLWSSPMYIDDAGIVVVGVGSGEESLQAPYSFRGSVVALEAASGNVVWQFYTTPDDASSGPGNAVWATAAVDTGRKLLYIGTGNNYAAPTGPYADSLLAIDYTTGALAWSHQFTIEDIFTVPNVLGGPDSDVGSTANLFSAGGKDLVGIGVKNGIYYALDRDSGAVAWMAPLTTGSVLGGVISPSAYADGVAFVASNRYSEGLSDVVALDVRDGHELWRTTIPAETTYGGVAHANGVVYVGTTAASVIALDGATGQMLWSDNTPDSIAGGPAVADGLLLVPWGYQWTLGRGNAGNGGLIAYGP